MRSKFLMFTVGLLTFGLLSENCSGYENESFHLTESSSNQEDEIIENFVVLIYFRNGVEYFLSKAEALSNSSPAEIGLYRIVTFTVDDNKLITIRKIPASPYPSMLQVSEQKLKISIYGTEFVAVPVSGSDMVNIVFNRTEGGEQGMFPLVAPLPVPPFEFYTSDRYPDEPAAEFYWRQATVLEAYSNQRENINRTLGLIKDPLFSDSAQGYSELLELMKGNGHLTDGPEIFTVAAQISEQLGTDHPVFAELPSTVQRLLKGGDLNLTMSYIQYPSEQYPMKYSWASKFNDDIKAYNISIMASNSTTTPGLWSISYSENMQLSLNSRDLQDVQSDIPQYLFQFHLMENSGFRIHSYNTTTRKFEPLLVREDYGSVIYFTNKANDDFPATPSMFFRVDSYDDTVDTSLQ